MSGDPRDLSGVWYGHYSGSNDPQENRFIVLVEEAGGVLDGSITEPDDMGIADIRRAWLTGTRAGAEVRFIKQYDGSGGFAHAVQYEGAVNDEGTLVTGRWIVEQVHGRFVMEREKFAADALEEAEEELVLIGAAPPRGRRRRSRVTPPKARRRP